MRRTSTSLWCSQCLHQTARSTKIPWLAAFFEKSIKLDWQNVCLQWKEIDQNDLMDSKLRCVFAMPPALVTNLLFYHWQHLQRAHFRRMLALRMASRRRSHCHLHLKSGSRPQSQCRYTLPHDFITSIINMGMVPSIASPVLNICSQQQWSRWAMLLLFWLVCIVFVMYSLNHKTLNKGPGSFALWKRDSTGYLSNHADCFRFRSRDRWMQPLARSRSLMNPWVSSGRRTLSWRCAV